MESSVVTTSSEVDNKIDAKDSLEMEIKSEEAENCVPDTPLVSDLKENSATEPAPIVNDVSKDKELSWEKIAAEVTESGDYQITTEDNVQTEVTTAPENDQNNKDHSSDIQTEEVTSNVEEEPSSVPLETSKEEISITEADSSDQVEEIVSNTVVVEEAADESTTNEEPAQESAQHEKATSVQDREVTPETSDKPQETVEISELKPEEEATLTETIEGVEYTVVEADEEETTEIIAEHLAQSGAGETIIIRTEESQNSSATEDDGDKNDDSYVEEIYILENENKDGETSIDDPGHNEEHDIKPKKPRGRKPIGDIPLHVLGRDITKPIEGVSNGGRSMPKPRLGVKVPYRNLTSQIVSKQEIEKEIMDRFKLKQEQNVANAGDLMFARKLTQNLAKKLIPPEKEKNAGLTAAKSEPGSTSETSKKPAEIQNDSDLLAILEGNDEDVSSVAKPPKTQEEKKETDREIALRQLRELPNVSGEDDNNKNKIHKTRTQQNEETKKPHAVQTPTKQSVKSDTSKASSENTKASLEKKNQVEIEPQLKTSMVLKTYTRKRKSLDMDPLILPKKAPAPPQVKTEDGSYVTKSSRVIKKKVIWDPDEVPNKSPIRSPKPDASSNKSPAAKPVEKKIEAKPAEKKVEAAIKSPEKKHVINKKKEVSDKVLEKKTPVVVKKLIKTSGIKKLKRLTEVDRLLMDEGAVNMLYEVKNNDESNQDRIKMKNKSIISLDRAHRELMNKTNVIKNDLQNTSTECQKSLRKKEVTPSPKKEGASPKKDGPSPKKDGVPSAITRKKSKDSTKSSVHSPPASPAFNVAEASRIIRRHSSSSFSSDGGADDNDNVEKVGRKRSTSSIESSKKKMKKTAEKVANKEAAKVNHTAPEAKVNSVEKNVGQYETFNATKSNHLVSIVLDHTATNGYLSEKVLKELICCVKELGNDDDCHVMSLTSNSERIFCRGLNYNVLSMEDESACKKKATELSSLVKEFLRCLLNFPKVLVAGIQGDCVGLGVTMLPLFDMIIASDTSTFSTPYARLGCSPEAGFLLTVPHLSSHGLASELLYTSQVVKADDAFRRGLLTRLCWPEKYHEEFKSLTTSIACQSKQSIVATKKQLRHQVLQVTEAALTAGSKVLIEHWTSAECQKKFANYNLDLE